MKKGEWLLKAIFIATFVLICSCDRKATDPLESSLLANNWQKVYDLASKDSLLTKPQTAGIVGHAAIMLNKNNISFILLKMMDADPIKKQGWLNWSEDFVKRFPKKAIGFYFLGDAYVRNGVKEKAMESFNKALDIDPKFALALNARGTIFILNKENGKATEDLNSACKLNPGIAEFYTSRGVMFYTFRAPEGAYQDFAKAVQLSPEFALALNGKACNELLNYKTPDNDAKVDSITYYFNSAFSQIKHPIFLENFRMFKVSIENKMYPGLKEIPFFRATDFLDWSELQKKASNDPNDLLSNLLKTPLPKQLTQDFLTSINRLLTGKNLFVNYLKREIPQSIRDLIAKEKGIEMLKLPETEIVVCKNRIVIEKYYEGLIVSFRKRDPGMVVAARHIATWLSNDVKKQEREQMNDRPGVWDKYKGEISLTPKIEIGSFGKLGRDIKQSWFEGTKKNAELAKTFAELDHHPGFPPGGALADIRKSLIDDGKAYFLLCLNGLGYDSE